MKNRDQIDAAVEAIKAGSGFQTIRNWQEALGSLLANLMLFADAENLNWKAAMEYAEDDFQAERGPKDTKFFIEVNDKGEKWVRLSKAYTEKEAYDLCKAFNVPGAEQNYRVVRI